MNALANSQLEELDKFLANVSGGSPSPLLVTRARRTAEQRQQIAENPPDILLTNFMMLELLMTRQDELDRKVIGNCAGLRFLVLDELHTYRGRQGADVALLVRRVRERLSPERLQCIGTSATMASEGSQTDKSRVVAGVASKLFAAAIPESNVIVETLERVTDPHVAEASVLKALGPAIDAGIAADGHGPRAARPPAGHLDRNPAGYRVVRPRPAMGTGSAADHYRGGRQALCEAAGRDPELVSTPSATYCSFRASQRRSAPVTREANPRSFFAFKLHQFISGAGHAFATLEPPGSANGDCRGAAISAGRSGEASVCRPLLPRLRAGVPPGPAR